MVPFAPNNDRIWLQWGPLTVSSPAISAFSSSGVHGLRVECNPSRRAVLEDLATAACRALSYKTEVGED